MVNENRAVKAGGPLLTPGSYQLALTWTHPSARRAGEPWVDPVCEPMVCGLRAVINGGFERSEVANAVTLER